VSSRAHIHIPTKPLDKATDGITWFVGSWIFLGASLVWFVLWIVLRVEPFPYGLLTMIVSLEAIFLSTLVMMSQNRQAAKDRHRDDLEAEEVSTMLNTHQELLELNRTQLKILNQQTDILHLLHEVK
jgi:uncharacterized membrane protein